MYGICAIWHISMQKAKKTWKIPKLCWASVCRWTSFYCIKHAFLFGFLPQRVRHICSLFGWLTFCLLNLPALRVFISESQSAESPGSMDCLNGSMAHTAYGQYNDMANSSFGCSTTQWSIVSGTYMFSPRIHAYSWPPLNMCQLKSFKGTFHTYIDHIYVGWLRGELTTPIQVRTMQTSDMQMLSTTIAIHAHHVCVCGGVGVCFWGGGLRNDSQPSHVSFHFWMSIFREFSPRFFWCLWLAFFISRVSWICWCHKNSFRLNFYCNRRSFVQGFETQRYCTFSILRTLFRELLKGFKALLFRRLTAYSLKQIKETN